MNPAPKPRPAPKTPRKAVKRVNATRRRKNWKRAYGSKEYVQWIHEQPCVRCGVVGFSEVAHLGNGGMGRKADVDRTVPLCGPRPGAGYLGTTYEGCHGVLHRYGPPLFDIDLDDEAKKTEQSWLASLPKERL